MPEHVYTLGFNYLARSNFTLRVCVYSYSFENGIIENLEQMARRLFNGANENHRCPSKYLPFSDAVGKITRVRFYESIKIDIITNYCVHVRLSRILILMGLGISLINTSYVARITFCKIFRHQIWVSSFAKLRANDKFWNHYKIMFIKRGGKIASWKLYLLERNMIRDK